MKLSSLSQATATITLDADLTAASEEALKEYQQALKTYQKIAKSAR